MYLQYYHIYYLQCYRIYLPTMILYVPTYNTIVYTCLQCNRMYLRTMLSYITSNNVIVYTYLQCNRRYLPTICITVVTLKLKVPSGAILSYLTWEPIGMTSYILLLPKASLAKTIIYDLASFSNLFLINSYPTIFVWHTIQI